MRTRWLARASILLLLIFVGVYVYRLLTPPAIPRPFIDVDKLVIPNILDAGQGTQLTITATNRGSRADQGSISLSIEGPAVFEAVNADTGDARVIKPGTCILKSNGTGGTPTSPLQTCRDPRHVVSVAPLAEAFVSRSKGWEAGASYSLSVTIRSTAAETANVKLYVRATLTKDAVDYTFPPDGEKVFRDQQGFRAYRWVVQAAALPPGDINLPDVAAGSGLSYTLKGKGRGDSTRMTLRIKNMTQRIWIVHVDIGTRLEPSDGDAQTMVVTKEVHVTVHPHDEAMAELEVACLDIAKRPPGENDDSWNVQALPRLAKFVVCAHHAFATAPKLHPQDASKYDAAQYGFTQFGLWRARGASRQQWVDFYIKYRHFTEDQAAQIVDQREEQLSKYFAHCPSL